MARFDRYLLSQCLQLFGFFGLVLVMVYWVNQAVTLFDRLIADGQTALVFLEFTALTLPNLIRIVLPIASFAAVVYVINRMSSDSEISVMQATGYSARRMARPVLYFGLVAAAFMALLMHVLVPISQERLAIRNAEVSQNVTGRLLREGVFSHPGADSTFYLRDMTANGELLDVFLAETVPDRRDQIFTAERAFLVRSENGPRLVLIDGQSQTLNPETGTLFVTNFDDFVIDIQSLVDSGASRTPALRELRTGQLIAPSPALLERTGKSTGAFAQEFHGRIAQPLFALVAALVGFATLLAGGFSRFGIWRQILIAIAFLVVLKSLEDVMAERVINNAALWPLTYVPAAFGLAIAWAGLLRADRTRRIPPRHADLAAEGAAP